ncbi:MAG TPA: LacI family DNA-binding transcriptional regulator [Pseudolysinimonas sp.]|jgi:DNA-binding LacI/PurR family transcriptional regulator|nr:LacI family DNA-binding transcriptional regulator [Pseudolysinimonas sp.]
MTPATSNLAIATARRATAADVATRAGVSRTTVSYILNDTPGQTFPDATRDAVIRAAAELGYRPNLAARALAGGRGLLLLVVPRLPQNEFTTAIASRLTTVLSEHGVLAAAVFEADDAAPLLRTVEDLRPRGVVFFAPPAPDVTQRIEALGAHVAGPIDQDAAPTGIGALQVDHLLARGHRRIAIAMPEDTAAYGVTVRRRDVEDAADAAGLPRPAAAAFVLDGSDASATIERWHSAGITAVCAYNDDVALTVLHGIRVAGLSCPRDLAVIGTDGIPSGAVAAPPLTTVAIDVGNAADWYAATLLGEMGYPDTAAAPDDILRLVVRDST